MFKSMPAFLAGAVLSAVTVTGVAVAGAETAPHAPAVAHTPPKLPPYMRHELAQEDGVNGWWNDGSGHPFYAVSVPLYGRDGRRVGRVACHLYETRTIHGSVATLCQRGRW